MTKPRSKLPPEPPPPPPPPASREETLEFLRWMYQERLNRKKPWRSFDDVAFLAAAQKRFKGDLRAFGRRIFSDLMRGPRPARSPEPLGKGEPPKGKPRRPAKRRPPKKKRAR